jgi:hypothetical protein
LFVHSCTVCFTLSEPSPDRPKVFPAAVVPTLSQVLEQGFSGCGLAAVLPDVDDPAFVCDNHYPVLLLPAGGYFITVIDFFAQTVDIIEIQRF